jgi:hypothetical protein
LQGRRGGPLVGASVGVAGLSTRLGPRTPASGLQAAHTTPRAHGPFHPPPASQAETLAGVFGCAPGAVAPDAALLWQMVGAGVAAVVGGACYTLKVVVGGWSGLSGWGSGPGGCQVVRAQSTALGRLPSPAPTVAGGRQLPRPQRVKVQVVRARGRDGRGAGIIHAVGRRRAKSPQAAWRSPARRAECAADRLRPAPLPLQPCARLNFGLAAGATGHVLMMAPLAMGAGGPLSPVLLAVWALTSEPEGGGRQGNEGVVEPGFAACSLGRFAPLGANRLTSTPFPRRPSHAPSAGGLRQRVRVSRAPSRAGPQAQRVCPLPALRMAWQGRGRGLAASGAADGRLRGRGTTHWVAAPHCVALRTCLPWRRRLWRL